VRADQQRRLGRRSEARRPRIGEPGRIQVGQRVRIVEPTRIVECALLEPPRVGRSARDHQRRALYLTARPIRAPDQLRPHAVPQGLVREPGDGLGHVRRQAEGRPRTWVFDQQPADGRGRGGAGQRLVQAAADRRTAGQVPCPLGGRCSLGEHSVTPRAGSCV